MNPIDASKKWILNKLIPLIEKQDNKKTSEENIFKGEAAKPSDSETSKEDTSEQYSDLLEDSEYPKE